MRRIRTYREVEEAGGALVEQVVAQRERLERRLASIGAVIAVASGKGGVGKSAITANLAVALAEAGKRVGALDADLNGPSLARMLGVTRMPLVDWAQGAEPPRGVAGVRVMSMELMQDEDEPLAWREPDHGRHLWQSTMETGVLREFVSDVAWGELDVLLLDIPPGTDKIGRVLEVMPRIDQLLLVTTPSEMSRAVVTRSAKLVAGEAIGVVGLICNMTEHVCPDCGKRTPLYPDEGGRRLSEETGLEEWARIPFDPLLAGSTDRGRPAVVARPESEASRAILRLADRVRQALES